MLSPSPPRASPRLSLSLAQARAHTHTHMHTPETQLPPALQKSTTRGLDFNLEQTREQRSLCVCGGGGMGGGGGFRGMWSTHASTQGPRQELKPKHTDCPQYDACVQTYQACVPTHKACVPTHRHVYKHTRHVYKAHAQQPYTSYTV